MVALYVFLIMASLSVASKQILADENWRYIYPIIETNCEQLNATAYRFYSGDTLNLTFAFKGTVLVHYEENYSSYIEVKRLQPNLYSYLFELLVSDGKVSNFGKTAAGNGRDFSWWEIGYLEGEHTLKVVYRFETNEEASYVINFHSPRRLGIREWTPSPMPLTPLLISGISGAAVAFAISAIVWHRKDSAKAKREENVNP